MFRKKVLAAMLVVLMISSCFLPLGSEGSDAAPTGDHYTYVLQYDASVMTNTSAAISVEGMQPIHHTGSGYESLDAGSWGFDPDTGLGPFNSFYAAFDALNGNRFVAILDPQDLSKRLDGTDLGTASTYNVMWVLPTVYWSTDASGNLTLTDDPAGGTAYAHTIDGHVYKYVAYGVYAGSRVNTDSGYIYTSISGVDPVTSQSRNSIRNMAHNYIMDSGLTTDPSNPAHSMVWTYYQWQLYRFCSLAVMEDFNSQNVVGNGNVYSATTQYIYRTGETDQDGPYAGNAGYITNAATGVGYGQDSVKLFIENAWGGAWGILDGVIVNGRSGFYVSQSSSPTDLTTGDYVTYIEAALPATSNWGSAIHTDARVWGIGSAAAGSVTTGLCDYVYTSANANMLMSVGGFSTSTASSSTYAGINYTDSRDNLNYANTHLGSRLSFVFDAIPEHTVTWNVDGSESVESYYQGQTPTYKGASAPNYDITGWTPSIVPVMADAVYQAVLTPITYMVTWNANGGTVDPDLSYGTVETPVSMPTPHYSEHDFTGWFTDPDEGERIYDPYYPTSDITLYAHWDTSDFIELKTLIFPLVAVLAILAMVALFFRSEGEGLSFQYMTVADMGKAVVGVAVATVIMVLLFFPIL